eukprot:365747-Chlamydomonas_euryale.AAC.6
MNVCRDPAWPTEAGHRIQVPWRGVAHRFTGWTGNRTGTLRPKRCLSTAMACPVMIGCLLLCFATTSCRWMNPLRHRWPTWYGAAISRAKEGGSKCDAPVSMDTGGTSDACSA